MMYRLAIAVKENRCTITYMEDMLHQLTFQVVSSPLSAGENLAWESLQYIQKTKQSITELGLESILGMRANMANDLVRLAVVLSGYAEEEITVFDSSKCIQIAVDLSALLETLREGMSEEEWRSTLLESLSLLGEEFAKFSDRFL